MTMLLLSQEVCCCCRDAVFGGGRRIHGDIYILPSTRHSPAISTFCVNRKWQFCVEIATELESV